MCRVWSRTECHDASRVFRPGLPLMRALLSARMDPTKKGCLRTVRFSSHLGCPRNRAVAVRVTTIDSKVRTNHGLVFASGK